MFKFEMSVAIVWTPPPHIQLPGQHVVYVAGLLVGLWLDRALHNEALSVHHFLLLLFLLEAWPLVGSHHPRSSFAVRKNEKNVLINKSSNGSLNWPWFFFLNLSFSFYMELTNFTVLKSLLIILKMLKVCQSENFPVYFLELKSEKNPKQLINNFFLYIWKYKK